MRRTTFGIAVAALLSAVLAGPAMAQVTQTTAPVQDEWIASGFAGPTFGATVQESNVGFGGTITYLREGVFGGEALATFTPDFGFAPGVAADASVNNYMANVVAAVAAGPNGRWQPFVSGGIGAMQIRGDVEDATGPVEFKDTQLGSNIGFGVMMFNNRWGLRTDLRYFSSLADDAADDDEPSIIDPTGVLTDTDFWRYNVGVAYRW
jgi:hypothetical protein